jgi:NTP pyrophosphatase (non-canonical NTP hydrolase)
MKNITFTPEQENIFIESVGLYGENSQLTQTNEEATELALAILKYQRAQKYDDEIKLQERRKELISEIADVVVMTRQCLLIFGVEEIQQEVNFKLRRQRQRIDKKINQNFQSVITLNQNLPGFPKISL